MTKAAIGCKKTRLPANPELYSINPVISQKLAPPVYESQTLPRRVSAPLLSGFEIGSEENMLDDWQDWWQNALPQIQAAIPDGMLVLGALLGGHFLGRMVSRGLRARNFDASGSWPSAC